MENNNGRGIFYGVIGVATLVVAMIGATFAYFSAEANTSNNALFATAANITLEMGTPVTTGLRTNIIPVDETNSAFATGGYIGVNPLDTIKIDHDGNPETPDQVDGKPDPRNFNCVDDDGNEFCSVYTFTVKNPSTTTAQKVYAKMDVVTNTFNKNDKKWCYDPDHCFDTDTACNAAKPDDKTCTEGCAYLEKTDETMYCENSNFAFAIFKGTADDVNDALENRTGAGWDVDGTAVTTYYGPTQASGVEMFDATNLNMNTNTTTSAKNVTADTATSTGNVPGTAVLGRLGDMVVNRTAVPALSGSNTHTFRLAALDQTLKPEGEVTYTVVMWLHENYEDQGDDETQVFAAGITFSTSLGGSGVTAVLSTAG